jgi:hypothetical protein
MMTARFGIRLILVALLTAAAARPVTAQCYEFSSGSDAKLTVNIKNLPVPEKEAPGIFIYDLTELPGNSVTLTLNGETRSATTGDHFQDVFNVYFYSGASEDNGLVVFAVHNDRRGNFFEASFALVAPNQGPFSDVKPDGLPKTLPPISAWDVQRSSFSAYISPETTRYKPFVGKVTDIGDTCPSSNGAKIYYGDADITGAVIPVVVGQPLALRGSPPVPPNSKRQLWSILPAGSSSLPAGTAVGGYSPTPTSFETGTTKPLDLTKSALMLYFVDAGPTGEMRYSVVYSCLLPSGNMVSAKAIFDVTGPTSPYVDTTMGAVKVGSLKHTKSGSPNIALFLGGLSSDPLFFNRFVPVLDTKELGISFFASVTQPEQAQGTLSFVQIITVDENIQGARTRSFSAHAALDNSFPYPSSISNSKRFTNDTPELTLQPGDTEAFASEAFETYLMWTPPFDHAIPVPLGVVSWQWSGSAYDAGGDTWKLKKEPACTAGFLEFRPGTQFPTWQSVVHNTER